MAIAAQRERFATLVPTRWIKESCRTSETLAGISHGAERLFWRLLTLADDFGRFEADPNVVLAFCFSKMLNTVKLRDVTGWIQELANADLVRLYESGDKRFGYFTTWDEHQNRRAKRSRFPAPADGCEQVPADANICQQMSADANICGQVRADAGSSDRPDLKKESTKERNSSSSSLSGIKAVKARCVPRNGLMPDDVFLASLRDNIAYRGFDLDAEFGKMDAWLLVHPDRKKTRRFIVNWLNKLERPLPARAAAPPGRPELHL